MNVGCYPFDGTWPEVADDVFIAPNSSVVGRVRLGAGVSIWYGAVLRGDVGTIDIGESTNIQDNAVIHCAPNDPSVIGAGVTVGHSAVLHGCVIGDNTLIGMGAVILNGAQIGSGCLVAGGSVVRERAVFGDNVMIAGSPAVVKRAMSPEQQAGIARGNVVYRERAAIQRKELAQ
jgi:carbonic anhydrase/acetyltransferase-like protein (isoleucine patch superfamily)